MKTNVDFNSPQEKVVFKSKEENKNIIKKKNEENLKINSPIKSLNENDEKNKEDENKNVYNNKDDEKKNENIMIEKINNEKKDNIYKDVNINNKIIKNAIEEEKREEDPLISYIISKRKISEEEIRNGSKLILEEIDGNLLNGKKIEINAGGMVEGRNKYDGFTIFGQKNISGGKDLTSNINSEISDFKQNNDNNIFKPDYELNYSKFLAYPYIFAIYYKKEEKSYYIRAYAGKGSDNKILFIKLTNKNKLLLKQRELISAGSIIFQITPLDNNYLEIINLSGKTNLNNKKIFDGANKKIVTIGRHKECDFFFAKDKSFSRYQTSFEFDENTKKWSIIDGKDNKGSTNGTWIFGTHSFLIKKEMIVEILNSKIKIIEINNKELKNE